MRTIAIINQKGGCGKTTVSINLAAVLASMGHRTLLVDMDPQAHCALGLAVPEAQIERSIGDMLRVGLDGTMAMSDVIWPVSRNLDLAPSTMALAAIEQELSGASDRDRRLAQVLSTVQEDYEVCIVDCPPAIGLLTFNALRASQEVIVPVETGYFAMQGAFKQEATVQMLVRRTGHRVRHKVLATMYDVRTKLAREILTELKKHFGDQLLPVVINFNSKLKEAASFGQPITEYDPGSRGMQDFERLAAWLLANPPEPPASAAAASVNPALSRAAELVERARALSARTAALASRMAADPQIASAERSPSLHIPAIDRPDPDDLSDPVDPQPNDLERHHELHELEAPSLRLQTDEPMSSSVAVIARLDRVFGVRPTQQGVLFVQPLPQAAQVSVAGDFNNWSPTATPLQRDDRLGVWQTCIPMTPGRHHYRLVVDGHWQNDQYNTRMETNPFGEINNVVEVTPTGT
ncbi:MAG: AAA family ATPase [Phycisphaeraceae bacterium]|nr:AAA family ATPase [Phycisphaeraceae bacterium]